MLGTPNRLGGNGQGLALKCEDIERRDVQDPSARSLPARIDRLARVKVPVVRRSRRAA